MKHYERGYVEIDLDAINQNMIHMHNNISEDTKMVGVIKTDAYGHGATIIAHELEQMDFVWGFAVATPEEAFTLRKEDIRRPILLLGYAFPYAYDNIIKDNIRSAVFTYEAAKALSDTAVKLKKKAMIHLKIDSGMSRIGIIPDQNGIEIIKQISKLPGIEMEGIFTHFARADEADKTNVLTQLAKYTEFLTHIEAEGIHIPLKHCSNSAGIVELKEANMNLVRAGITLYGLWPSDEIDKTIVTLTPVLSLHSRIVHIKTVPANTAVSYGGTYVTKRETKIATIPLGYGDGYPRMLSNKADVIIKGHRYPIIGRICMDQFMVDITDGLDTILTGDKVTLIGKDGSVSISMEELGTISGRFNYELACDISKRLPRVYRKKEKIVAVLDHFNDVSPQNISNEEVIL